MKGEANVRLDATYYRHFVFRQSRWNDNVDIRNVLARVFLSARAYRKLTTQDAFGHINNTIYYGFMDDAVNDHLIANGICPAGYPRLCVFSNDT